MDTARIINLLASHNTLTYLPVKQWWLKPFGWIGKCQNKNIFRQALRCNIFDIRVGFTKNKNGRYTAVPKHGLLVYKGDIYSILNELYFVRNYMSWFYPGYRIYVRILLEHNKRESNIEQHFKNFCEEIKSYYYTIIFCGGETKADWSKIYDFNNNLPPIEEWYSSMPSNKNRLWSIFPWLWNKLHPYKHKTTKYLMVDFI